MDPITFLAATILLIAFIILEARYVQLQDRDKRWVVLLCTVMGVGFIMVLIEVSAFALWLFICLGIVLAKLIWQAVKTLMDTQQERREAFRSQVERLEELLDWGSDEFS